MGVDCLQHVAKCEVEPSMVSLNTSPPLHFLFCSPLLLFRIFLCLLHNNDILLSNAGLPNHLWMWTLRFFNQRQALNNEPWKMRKQGGKTRNRKPSVKRSKGKGETLSRGYRWQSNMSNWCRSHSSSSPKSLGLLRREPRRLGMNLRRGWNKWIEKEKDKALQKASNKGIMDAKASLQGQLRGTCNKY